MPIGTRIDLRSRRRSCEVSRDAHSLLDVPPRRSTSGNSPRRNSTCQHINSSAKGTQAKITHGFLTGVMIIAAYLFIGYYDRGMRTRNNEDLNRNNTPVCTIDRVRIEEFINENYIHKRPVIVTIPNGAATSWADCDKWTVEQLQSLENEWLEHSDNVHSESKNSYDRLEDFLQLSGYDPFRDKHLNTYVLSNSFLDFSGLVINLRLRQSIPIQGPFEKSVNVQGISKSLTFTKDREIWTGLISGRRQWFLYSKETTPPGGIWPLYSPRDWLHDVYPHVTGDQRPIECIQEPGEIIYIPDNFYRASLNLEQIVEVALQSEEIPGDNFETKDNTEVLMSLAEAGARGDQIDDAMRLLEITITSDPFNVKGYTLLARLKQQQGKSEEAEILFIEALQYNPGALAYTEYGDLLMQLNRPHEALEQYLQALKLTPDMEGLTTRILAAEESIN